MSNTYYEQIVGGFSHSLRALSAILDKAQSHAVANKFDAANILSSRLFPDMFNCTRQFQIATDVAKGAARLTGSEPPKWEDTETTVEELQARIQYRRAPRTHRRMVGAICEVSGARGQVHKQSRCCLIPL